MKLKDNIWAYAKRFERFFQTGETGFNFSEKEKKYLEEQRSIARKKITDPSLGDDHQDQYRLFFIREDLHNVYSLLLDDFMLFKNAILLHHIGEEMKNSKIEYYNEADQRALLNLDEKVAKTILKKLYYYINAGIGFRGLGASVCPFCIWRRDEDINDTTLDSCVYHAINCDDCTCMVDRITMLLLNKSNKTIDLGAILPNAMYKKFFEDRNINSEGDLT